MQQRLYNDSDAEILIVGAGTSNLGAFLYQQGFHCVTNVDFSAVVVEYMKEKHRQMDEMDYVELDVASSSLDIAEESFNCIVDKATLDSVACCADDQSRVHAML